MNDKLNVIVLEPGGEPTQMAVVGDLDTLKAIVGGWLEMVPLDGRPGYLLINEEGKIFELPLNDRATALARLNGLDVIVGTAVLVGPLDSDGEWTDVDPSVAAELVPEAVA